MALRKGRSEKNLNFIFIPSGLYPPAQQSTGVLGISKSTLTFAKVSLLNRIGSIGAFY